MSEAIGSALAAGGGRTKPKETDQAADGGGEHESMLASLGCAVLTCAKWCPLENCTVLVIGGY